MFMEGSLIFKFFCNDDALILHLNVVTLLVKFTSLQRVNATTVKHTKTLTLSFSFGKVLKFLSETFFKVSFSLVHPASEVLVNFVILYDFVLIWFFSFSQIANCKIFVLFVA